MHHYLHHQFVLFVSFDSASSNHKKVTHLKAKKTVNEANISKREQLLLFKFVREKK